MNTPLDRLVDLIQQKPGETPRNWSCTGDLDMPGFTAKLATFESLVPELRAEYGDALSLKLKDGEFVHFTIDNPNFDELRAAIGTGAALTIDANVDKAKLAAKLQFTDPAVTTRLFFGRQALVSALTVGLPRLETELFAGVPAGRKLVIILPGDDLHLDGDFLAITNANRWRSTISVPSAEPAMHERAKKQVYWSGDLPVRLTPEHLLVQGEAQSGDAVAAALYANLFALALIYLAQRTENKAGEIRCTFSADRQEAEIVVTTPAMAAAEDWMAARQLAELASWIYRVENEADDRFVVVQHTFVDALKHNSAGTTAAEVLRLAPALVKRAQWGWEAFVGGQLKKYFDQVKALEEAVAATARDYAEQVTTMTTSLSTNMLAAVAVVVGSFIAGLLKTPFADAVFIIGVGVYAVYLLVFPLAVGLGSTRGRFENTKRNFETRKTSFERRLGQAQVDDIVKPVLDSSEPRFWWWYWCTFWIYTGVLLLLVIGVFAVPMFTVNPDDFSVAAAKVNEPVAGAVTIRGEHFDRRKEIVVTLGRSTFTNAANPPTLNVFGTALTFTPDKRDLDAKVLTVRQGSVGPKVLSLP